MNIELRLLRSFVEIYEGGSLSRAAHALGCTQAAMSMRLKLLEDELARPLFIRRHHRLEPTPFAADFYAKALVVLASYDELISASRSRTLIERVRIGIPDDYALGFLPAVIASLRTSLPAIDLDIRCDLSANLAAAMEKQELDIAIATLANPPDTAILLGEPGLHWVGTAAWAEGAPLPVALAAYPEGCVFRKAMIAALDGAGLGWRVAVQSRNHAGIIAGLRSGAAVTAMARGTIPSGLVSLGDRRSLPALGHAPIYSLRRDGSARHVDELEAALKLAISAGCEDDAGPAVRSTGIALRAGAAGGA
ncbi:MAG: LysR family transcriptional regulator [Parvibaculaceae bacterium]